MVKRDNQKNGTFDVDSFLNSMEDYTEENQSILEDFLSDDEVPDGANDYNGGSDNEDDDFNYDEQTYMSDDSDDNPKEQSADDYLKNFTIEDEDLSEITLEDYNIQEDIVLADGRKSFPFKKVILFIFGSIICFALVLIIVFFNNYDLVPEKIKNATWSNDSYSIIPKGYIVDIKDIYYGETIMYVNNSGDFIKTYHYATIIDKKMKSPRAIKIFDNATAIETTISIENIAFIVDTDINESVAPISDEEFDKIVEDINGEDAVNE